MNTRRRIRSRGALVAAGLSLLVLAMPSAGAADHTHRSPSSHVRLDSRYLQPIDPALGFAVSRVSSVAGDLWVYGEVVNVSSIGLSGIRLAVGLRGHDKQTVLLTKLMPGHAQAVRFRLRGHGERPPRFVTIDVVRATPNYRHLRPY